MGNKQTRRRSSASARVSVLQPQEDLGPRGVGLAKKVRDPARGEVVLVTLDGAAVGNARARRYFKRHLEAATALEHPAFVRVLDGGTDDGEGRAYLLEAPCAGETLRQALADGPLPAEQALRLGIDLLNGLAHAHHRGLVHGGLTPDGVLVEATPGGPRARIVDHGFARVVAPEQETTLGPVRVDTDYAAPEMIKGEAADERADVYSVGLLLQEALTGKHPIPAPPKNRVLARLNDTAPDLPAGTFQDRALDDAVRAALRVALHKNPARRFASARAFALALRPGAPAGATGAATHAAPGGGACDGCQATIKPAAERTWSRHESDQPFVCPGCKGTFCGKTHWDARALSCKKCHERPIVPAEGPAPVDVVLTLAPPAEVAAPAGPQDRPTRSLVDARREALRGLLDRDSSEDWRTLKGEASANEARGDAAKPDAAKPDAAKPAAAKPAAAKPADAKPAAAKPAAAKPAAAKPADAKPAAARPDAARPDAARPDGAKPDGAKPDAAKPDAAKPDAAKPDAAKPDGDPEVAAGAAARSATARLEEGKNDAMAQIWADEKARHREASERSEAAPRPVSVTPARQTPADADKPGAADMSGYKLVAAALGLLLLFVLFGWQQDSATLRAASQRQVEAEQRRASEAATLAEQRGQAAVKLTGELGELKETEATLRQEKTDLERRLAATSAGQAAALEEKRSLEAQLTDVGRARDALLAERDALQERATAASGELLALEQERAEVQRRLASESANRQGLEARLGEVETAQATLEAERALLSARLQGVGQALDASQGKRQELERRLRGALVRLEDQAMELDDLQLQLLAASRVQEALADEKQALERRLAEAQEVLRAQQDLLTVLALETPESRRLLAHAVSAEGLLVASDRPALEPAPGGRVLLSADVLEARSALDAAAEERGLATIRLELDAAPGFDVRVSVRAVDAVESAGGALPLEGWQALPAVVDREGRVVRAWLEPALAASLLARPGALALLVEPAPGASGPSCQVTSAHLVVTPLTDDVAARLRASR